MNSPPFKILGLVLLGNIIDYYDFLLFAHLGYLITAEFIPNLSSTNTHLMSLALFSIPFIVRPLGGYLFGRISDINSRTIALAKTLKYACFATLGLALLPSYEQGGILCAWLFIFLRAAQGLSLGGEYTTAGTYLMENYKKRQGLISGVLAASGTVGSLFAFSFAWLQVTQQIPPSLWRVAFLIGAVMTYLSYRLRQAFHKKTAMPADKKSNDYLVPSKKQAIIMVLFIGALVSMTTFLPMVYSQFFVTKILGMPLLYGLKSTGIALLSYIVLTPFFGWLSDRFSAESVMTFGAFAVIPLSFLGFYYLEQGFLSAQILLILSSAIFGAPIHVLMNKLFPANIRSRYVNSFFMLGTAIGSLNLAISGYLSSHFQWNYMPIVPISIVGLVIFGLFKYWIPGIAGSDTASRSQCIGESEGA